MDARAEFEVEPLYVPRWIKREHEAEAINLYHLARTALAGSRYDRYDRLIWASREFTKKYDYLTATAAYKDLDCMTRR